jgi:XTP/dITP diphosphohydrolase
MVDMVIATRNPKKFRELKALLATPGVRWRSLATFPQVPLVGETGRTFEQNAVKKALVVTRATGRPVVADDSGLGVDALNGAPGVRSARFAGRHGDDQANNAKLLRLLRGVPSSRRKARFRCALALASPERVVAVTEGTLVGRIATAPRGHGGFGYDPIFIVPRLKKTVAQLRPTVKNRISHRAKAAARMRTILVRLLTHGAV